MLKAYFSLIQRLNDRQTGELWETLTPAEKEELLLSYEESFDPDNLISHDQVKKAYQVARKIIWTKRAQSKFEKNSCLL